MSKCPQLIKVSCCFNVKGQLKTNVRLLFMSSNKAILCVFIMSFMSGWHSSLSADFCFLTSHTIFFAKKKIAHSCPDNSAAPIGEPSVLLVT